MRRVCSQAGLRITLVALGIFVLAMAGCSSNKSVNNSGAVGKMVLLVHDTPVDNFKEVWLTVQSVTMLGADADSTSAGTILLSNPIRMNFLDLDSTAQILASAQVAAGSYSKIRLQVTDPEFVRTDDSVFSGDRVQLVANGHVDINTQGHALVVGNEVTVVSLDLNVKNSIQINQTGNGRYILRPQIFVDNNMTGNKGIIIDRAVVTSVDLSTKVVIIKTSGTESDASLTVSTNAQTQILAVGGLPIGLAALIVGSAIDIVGTIDLSTGLVTASRIQVMT